MIDERFRRALARVAVRPIVMLQRLGATPNQVTIAAFLLGAVAAGSTATGRLRLGLGFWIASRILDGLDGLLARASGRATLFGGFLDITLDMLVYSLMAFAFAIAMPADWALWMIVLIGYVMAITTTLALSSLLERADRDVGGGDRALRFTAGLAEGGETTIVYVLIALNPGWSRSVLLVWIALLAATMIQRGVLARRLLR